VSASAPVVVQLKQAPIMAIKPTGEEVQLAEVVTPPPAANTETKTVSKVTETTTTTTIPSTASNLPLIGLLGLMALGGAFAARTAAKRLQ